MTFPIVVGIVVAMFGQGSPRITMFAPFPATSAGISRSLHNPLFVGVQPALIGFGSFEVPLCTRFPGNPVMVFRGSEVKLRFDKANTDHTPAAAGPQR
jgi:hypothetical protein